MTENQMTRRVPFAMPDIGSAEIDAVTSVLRSGWLTTGEQCAQFEREFAQAVGASHAVAVNSCTAAMHLSLEALDVQPGDLVFTSPYTFASTAEVVRYLGATPVFVDIDPVTLNIDPTALREAVTASLSAGRGRPRAIIPVHIAGLPCAMDEIWALARDTGLAVVEDAAHAFPSAHGSGKVGTIPADVEGTACFSFYATKTMTTGEGGMLVTERAEVADRARMMSLHGLSRQAWSRYAEGGHWAYDIAALGFKYNLSDIAAAMGRVQLARSDEMTRRRGEVAAAYTAALSSVPGIECPATPTDVSHSWHLYVIRLDVAGGMSRDAFIADLGSQGIGTSVHFIPLHQHSNYVETYGFGAEDFPHAHAESERVVSLPIYSAMADADVEHVIAGVTAAASRAERAP